MLTKHGKKKKKKKEKKRSGLFTDIPAHEIIRIMVIVV